jgi:hypothetical protein
LQNGKGRGGDISQLTPSPVFQRPPRPLAFLITLIFRLRRKTDTLMTDWPLLMHPRKINCNSWKTLRMFTSSNSKKNTKGMS